MTLEAIAIELYSHVIIFILQVTCICMYVQEFLIHYCPGAYGYAVHVSFIDFHFELFHSCTLRLRAHFFNASVITVKLTGFAGYHNQNKDLNNLSISENLSVPRNDGKKQKQQQKQL